MDAEKWNRILEIFEAAVSRPIEERESLLKDRLGDDTELLEEVRSLLENADLEDSFLEPPEGSLPSGTPPEIGDHLGEFELLEEIGRGGTGIVFRARQSPLDRVVAIKWLFPSPRDVPGRTVRIAVEARLQSRLRHPGIVTVHDVKQEGGTAWLVMDYVEGHPLNQEILALSGEGALPEGMPPTLPPAWSRGYIGAVARLMVKAAEALDHAHQRGIVHRDVKPHNLLLDESGEPLWVDFGLARDARYGSPADSSDLVGTPYYMSPEQVRQSRSGLDHRTDIYSLGVVLYELLTLRRPFQGTTLQDIFQKLLNGDAPRPRALDARVPRGMEAICLMAMSRNPADRYETAKQFSQDLVRFLNFEPLLAERKTVFLRLARFYKRHRRATRIAASLLVAVIIGVWMGSYLLARAALPRVALDPRDIHGRPTLAVGTTYFRRIHELSGIPGKRNELGKFPLPPTRVEPGFYRFIVRFADGTTNEATRYLAPSSGTHRVRVTHRPDSNFDGMARITGGEFQPWLPSNTLCPNATGALQVAPVWIDATEVSNGQYREFVLATSREEPHQWQGRWDPAWADLPVTGISQRDAQAFAEWSGKRLPTHPEWELAARGLEGRLLPWEKLPPGSPLRGNTQGERTRFLESLDETFAEYVSNVATVTEHRGDFTPDPVPILHLLGNVREFTESPVVGLVDGNPTADFSHCYVMGGAWNAEQTRTDLTQHMAYGVSDDHRANFIGFRCARSVEP